MTFAEKPNHVPGLRNWGYCDGVTSYLITFDTWHPHFGYGASFKVKHGHVNDLGTFDTKEDAERALERVASQLETAH